MLDATVRGGILIARSPVGRTGAWRHLGAQTRQKQANRKGGVPGAHPASSVSPAVRLLSPARLFRVLPSRPAEFAPGSLRGGAYWQPAVCVINLRPKPRLSTWILWHHGGNRGPPAAEALLPAARPLQPHGGPHAALVSEPGGIREGGRAPQAVWDLRRTRESCPGDTSAGDGLGRRAEGGVDRLAAGRGPGVVDQVWVDLPTRSGKRKTLLLKLK